MQYTQLLEEFAGKCVNTFELKELWQVAKSPEAFWVISGSPTKVSEVLIHTLKELGTFKSPYIHGKRIRESGG